MYRAVRGPWQTAARPHEARAPHAADPKSPETGRPDLAGDPAAPGARPAASARAPPSNAGSQSIAARTASAESASPRVRRWSWSWPFGDQQRLAACQGAFDRVAVRTRLPSVLRALSLANIVSG